MSEINHPPLISVVIPTYNRAEFISSAIDSVLSQTHRNLELIIVDDGSTDNTEKIVNKYDSVRYIKINNHGVGYARNIGIKASKGEYIAFLDSDDMWSCNKLELQLSHYLEHPDAGIIVGSCGYIDKNGNKIGSKDISPPVISNEEMEIFMAIPGGPCNVLIKKSILDDIGGFDTSLLRSEDRDLWMRISRKYPVYGIQEVTCLVRLHQTPRHKINFDVIKNNRVLVNKRIKNKKFKRKADAWMYYCFFKLYYNNAEKILALKYLFLSFIIYPFNIHSRCKRLRMAAEMILPVHIYNILGSIKHHFT